MSDIERALLHTVKAAATRMSVSPSSIWRGIKQQDIEAVHLFGRTLIPESELLRLIEEAKKGQVGRRSRRGGRKGRR